MQLAHQELERIYTVVTFNIIVFTSVIDVVITRKQPSPPGL